MVVLRNSDEKRVTFRARPRGPERYCKQDSRSACSQAPKGTEAAHGMAIMQTEQHAMRNVSVSIGARPCPDVRLRAGAGGNQTNGYRGPSIRSTAEGARSFARPGERRLRRTAEVEAWGFLHYSARRRSTSRFTARAMISPQVGDGVEYCSIAE